MTSAEGADRNLVERAGIMGAEFEAPRFAAGGAVEVFTTANGVRYSAKEWQQVQREEKLTAVLDRLARVLEQLDDRLRREANARDEATLQKP